MSAARPANRREFWERQRDIERERDASWMKLDQIARAASESGEERRIDEAARLLIEWQWEESQRDPWFFLRTLVTTMDEHADVEAGQAAYRPFPPHRYLEIITREWQMEPLNAIPKSRQVMVTWLHVALYVWVCLTQQARGVAVQSKKQDDAFKLCKRAHGIWERLPPAIKELHPAILRQEPPSLEFPRTNSVIYGIAQGADQIRMNTVSHWFSDEMAFQEEVEAAYTAAQPTIDGGGRASLVSSAAPGFFWDLCQGRLGEDDQIIPGSIEALLPSWHQLSGITAWRTESGFRVLRTHYSADPTKNPDWAGYASRKYGGMKSKRWRAEMEIDPEARYAGRVYPEFSVKTHVVPAFEVPDDWPFWWGIDPGFRNPCACVKIALDGDGTFWVVDEVYVRETLIPDICQMIKGKTGRLQSEYNVIDSQAFEKTLQAGGISVAEKFAVEGVFVVPGSKDKKSGIEEMSALMKIAGDGEPRIKVFDTCTNWIFEAENYRWMDLPAAAKGKRDQPEETVKKDDHLMDCTRYVLHHVGKNYYKRYGKSDPYLSLRPGKTLKQRFRQQLQMARDGGDYDGDLWDG